MQKVVKVVLIGAGFDTGNLGVSALAAGTIESLLCSFPEARVTLLDYAKKPSFIRLRRLKGNVRIRLINIRFSKRLWLPNHVVRLLATAALARLFGFDLNVSKTRGVLGTLRQMDLAIAITGGDSFSDIYGLTRLIYSLLPQWLVLVLGKPLILLP